MKFVLCEATLYRCPSSLPVTRPSSLTLVHSHHPCNELASTSPTSPSPRSATGSRSELVCCMVIPLHILSPLPPKISHAILLLTHAHVSVRSEPMARTGAQTVRAGVICWCLRGHLVLFGSALARGWSVISRVRLQRLILTAFTCICMLGS